MQPRRRVVVTGMGVLSPLGHDLVQTWAGLRAGRSGVRRIEAWQEVPDLGPQVAALVEAVDFASQIDRRLRRSMGKVAQLAVLAARQAVAEAKLTEAELADPRLGVALGSTTGSPAATLEWYGNILGPGMRANKATSFFQVMSHTCAANVALALGVRGRIWAPNSACTSASQAIGLAFESIAAGTTDRMLAGGAEEAHYTTAATFEQAGAASRGFNAEPEATPRPFDRRRDGMVVGEGAGVLLLEAEEVARARGATVVGEVLGFATNCDASHMSSPEADGMEACMAAALAAAGLTASDIDYVSAHATGTVLGDAAEARATARLFGDRVPVASLKGHFGHTLGACGALESIACLAMLRHGELVPTKNLENIDPECRGPWLLQTPLVRPARRILKNNFAFGGINTSLVLAAPAH